VTDERNQHEQEPEVPSAEAVVREQFDQAEDQLVELFLQEGDNTIWKRAFLIVAAVMIVALLVPFPSADKTEVDERVIYMPEIEEYIPPVKQPEKVEIKETKKVKKVALPDPTPEEPEPIIEPTPEPEPEPIPQNVVIKRGLPRGPPRKSSGPIREGTAGLTPPQLKKEVPPTYPEAAKRIGFGGTVVIRAVIGTDGKVVAADVLKGLGKFGMDEAALEAVKKREYTPGVLEGRPVEVISTIRITFTLTG
jgi:protein TonB